MRVDNMGKFLDCTNEAEQEVHQLLKKFTYIPNVGIVDHRKQNIAHPKPNPGICCITVSQAYYKQARKRPCEIRGIVI